MLCNDPTPVHPPLGTLIDEDFCREMLQVKRVERQVGAHVAPGGVPPAGEQQGVEEGTDGLRFAARGGGELVGDDGPSDAADGTDDPEGGSHGHLHG